MFINSPGGSVTAGMGIYDAMMMCRADVQVGRAGRADGPRRIAGGHMWLGWHGMRHCSMALAWHARARAELQLHCSHRSRCGL